MAKFKPESITDIHVSHHGDSNFAAGWNADGARFHTWFNPCTMARAGGYGHTKNGQSVIYKNPPLGVKTKDPEHFETRQLDPEKPRNVEILAHVFAEIDRLGLVAAAYQAEREKRAAADRENEERYRQARIRCAGPAMLQLCREILFGDGTGDSHQKAIDFSRAMLAEVGETRDHPDTVDLTLPPGDARVAAYRATIAATIAANLEH